MGTNHFDFTYLDPNSQIDLVKDTKKFLDEIDEAIENNSTEVTDYGYLSNFRYAYNPPSGYDTANLIEIAMRDKEVFAEHSWSYSTQVSTIPLFTEPYTVTNIRGEVTSCSAFVCDCLFKNGYSDLTGEAHIIGAGTGNLSLDEYLMGKGWEKVTSIAELQPGAIVGTAWRTYANVPGHCFIYAGPTEKYDCGSTSLIRSGGADALNWTLYGTGNSETQINRINRSGFIAFKAPYPFDRSYNYEAKETETLEYSGFSVYDYPYIMVQAACQKGRVTRFSNDDGRTWKDLADGMLQNAIFDANVSGGSAQAVTAANTEANPKTVKWFNANNTDFATLRTSNFYGIAQEGLYSLGISLTFGVENASENARIGAVIVKAPAGTPADDGTIIGKFVTTATGKTQLNISITESFDENDILYIRVFTENFQDATASLWTNKEWTNSKIAKIR